MHSLGPYMFRYEPNPHHDIFRPQFSLVLKDPAPFHCAMLVAANTLARLSGQSLPGLRVLYHRIEAIRLINERFARFNIHDNAQHLSRDQEGCLSETSILAVMLLTGFELKKWQLIGKQEVQATGFQQLLVLKGGLKALGQHPVLETALYGIVLMTPSMMAAASPALYQTGQPHLDGILEQHALAVELMEFLTTTVVSEKQNSVPFSMLEFAFEPGSSMQQLMLSPPQMEGVYKDEAAILKERLRASVLFYVHCLIGAQKLPEDRLTLVNHLKWLIHREWIWKKSLRMLNWMLINKEETDGLADSDSAWRAMRLVNALFLLQGTQGMVQEYLLGLLSGERRVSLDLERVSKELGVH